MTNGKYRAGQIDTMLEAIREGQKETHQKLDAILERQRLGEIGHAELRVRVDELDQDMAQMQGVNRRYDFLSALVGVVAAAISGTIAGNKG